MKTNKEITNFLSEKVISNLKKKVDATISNLKKGQRSFFPGLSWKYALLLLAGITFIIIAIISFKTISFQSQERNNQRGKSGIQIKLIDPIGSKPLKKFLLFKWSKCKDTDYYILDLFNEALSPIWTSEKIYENYFNFSNHETKKLVRNKVYFWMVTALFPEGRKIESPLQKFILTY